jgi:hypothetical protein
MLTCLYFVLIYFFDLINGLNRSLKIKEYLYIHTWRHYANRRSQNVFIMEYFGNYYF